LTGTFFPIDNFAKWLQDFASFLPLYNLNESLRYVYLDNANLLDRDVITHLGALAVWAVILYVIAIKVFRVR